MDSTELEQAMRDLEYFHHLRCLPGAWIVLRLDGRSFSKLTASQFDKPFDIRFRDVMYQTCKALLEELQGIYGYTESDEISLLFRRDWNLFDREVEKLVSISASIASATFTLACQQVAHFDSRDRLLSVATGGCGSLRLEWVVSLVAGERRKNPGRGDGRVEWTIRRL